MNGEQMLKEMAEQPTVLRALGERRGEIAELLRHTVPSRLRGIVLVARGSSDNAAVHGRYLLEVATQVPVAMAAPSLYTRYGVRPKLDGFLAIGVSQSGATPEIVSALQTLGGCGAATVAIVNVDDSPLADAADATVFLDAGAEHAVPATKTFTAQAAAFSLIADALAAQPLWSPAGWELALDAVADALATPTLVDGLVEQLVQATQILPVGRGFLYGAALEVGLKIAETTGLAVTGTSPADLQHGPIATVGSGTWGICLASPGPVAGDIQGIAEALVGRGARVAAITGDPALVPPADLVLPVLAGVPEPLAVLPQVIRGQQLGRATALARHVDPDAPFALSKVTRTE